MMAYPTITIETRMGVRKPLIILIAVLSLFIASEVGAGCGWVLWESYGKIGKEIWVEGSWRIVDSAKDIESCKKKLLKSWEYNKEIHTGPGNKVYGGISETKANISVVSKKKPITTISLLCLPDTIDPRAPKQ